MEHIEDQVSLTCHSASLTAALQTGMPLPQIKPGSLRKQFSSVHLQSQQFIQARVTNATYTKTQDPS